MSARRTHRSARGVRSRWRLADRRYVRCHVGQRRARCDRACSLSTQRRHPFPGCRTRAQSGPNRHVRSPGLAARAVSRGARRRPIPIDVRTTGGGSRPRRRWRQGVPSQRGAVAPPRRLRARIDRRSQRRPVAPLATAGAGGGELVREGRSPVPRSSGDPRRDSPVPHRRPRGQGRRRGRFGDPVGQAGDRGAQPAAPRRPARRSARRGARCPPCRPGVGGALRRMAPDEVTRVGDPSGHRRGGRPPTPGRRVR